MTASGSCEHVMPCLNVWVSGRYGNVPLVVTENGVSVPGEQKMTEDEAIDDQFRVDFLKVRNGSRNGFGK
jgi:beta-glucosidase/6-phospho-beta-glucosidase/beta-galactosidase